MIKNLVFDFGKVLVDYDFNYVDSFFDDKDELSRFKKLIVSDEFIDKCDKEDIPFAELVRQQKEKHPEWHNQLQMFHDHYADFVLGEMPGMRELLTRLKGEGFRLYGVTNWCSIVHEVMRRHHEIFSLLDGRVISSEEHVLKPDTAIYKILFNRYGLKPEECLFADDKVKNVEGAKAAGMNGVVFTNATEYEKALKNIIKQN